MGKIRRRPKVRSRKDAPSYRGIRVAVSHIDKALQSIALSSDRIERLLGQDADPQLRKVLGKTVSPYYKLSDAWEEVESVLKRL
jgi:hypothetical protein